jgi:hypothetical protein
MYLVFEQLVVPPTYIPNSIGNQFPIMVQLVTSKDRQPIQQHVITSVPTTIQVTTNLLTYVPKCSNHQPPNGEQFADSPRGSSFRRDPLGEPPFNPPITCFGWLAHVLCMFTPPWYQPPVVQIVLESTTKQPYNKLQYPTYVKGTNPDVHIRVFKKAIKGATMKVDIINLFYPRG